MKKLFCMLLTFCLLLTALPILAASEGDKILFAPDAPCVIVTSDEAAPQERYAAETLQRYLTEITGKRPDIVSDALPVADREIAVGHTLRSEANCSLPNGGYHIGFSGSTLCIEGCGGKGTINGVYAFLREYCGCRWYARDEIVIPKADTLSISANVDVTYRPYFEYTETDWLGSPFDTEFSLANGLNGGTMRRLSAEQGGSVKYLGGFCHTLSTRFCAKDKYFDDHPEYFALHDGKRTGNQLCLTNPDTLRIVTEEVLDVLRAQYDPDADLQIVSVTQHDNREFCECDACKKLDDANGSHAGTMITFANAVADAVKAAGYDNVAVDTFAYEYTRKPPTNVVPRDNVIVRLCSIECCFCHTLDDDRCRENRAFMQDLRDWGKICSRIYIWDYTTDYFETVCLYPDFGVLQRNIQIFYENGAKGVFEEGNASENINCEFAALRAYLLSRLMQDPYLDYDAEMHGFLDAYYGEAGKPICRFLERVTEKAGAWYTSRLAVFPDCKDILPAFTASDVAYCDAQWQQALQAAEETRYFDRTERSSVSWRYWKCANRRGEFSYFRSTIFSRMQGREALYNDMVRMGVELITSCRRSRELTSCRGLILLRRPGTWCALYENAFWDLLSPIADALLRLA